MTTVKFDFSQFIADRVPADGGDRAPGRVRYDFGTGYPDPGSFPWEGLHEALGRALKEQGRDLVRYSDPQGHPEMRQLITEKLARERGMSIHPDEVLVTGGSGAAIGLFVQLFTNPGDVLLTEAFTYVGTLGIMRNLQARIVGIDCDDEGMNPDALDQTIKDLARLSITPKLIYTIPTFQNPTGTDMGAQRRKDILAVAQKHGIPVYEDDAYEDLRFQGERTPAIHSYDDSNMVVYSGTFSKILAPGVRVAFLTAPKELMPRINSMYWGRPTSQFAVLAALYYLRDHLDDHVSEICDILRSRRDTMAAALGECMGSAVTVSQPAGGLYLWARLPEGANTTPVMEKARQKGVAYLAGARFSPSSTGSNYFRLCFGYENGQGIREGIATLARVFAEEGLLEF